jgi:hypothetical protein
MRGEMVRYTTFIAKGLFADESDRPANVRSMPRRKRTAEKILASEQLAHEAHQEIVEAKERVAERQDQRTRRQKPSRAADAC